MMPAVKWIKTKFLGVRYREHKTRKHGIKFDRCYSIRYKLDGKDKEEVVGWASQGITPEIASQRLSELRDNARLGTGDKTLEEKRKRLQKEEEAKAKAEKLAAQTNITLSEYWKTVYLPYAISAKKKETVRPERNQMDKYILPLLGESEINLIDMNKWDSLASLIQKEEYALSSRTKEYIIGTLRRVLTHAQDRGYNVFIPKTKQLGIKKTHDNRRQRVITGEESAKILARLQELDIATYNLVKFAMNTGCRLSEATHLRWAQINFENKTGQFINTKNKENRLFYLSDGLYDLLLSIKQDDTNGYVFLKSNGKPFFKVEDETETPHFFKRTIKELGLNEGRDKLDRISFHSIRHTVATNLAKILDVRSLMDVMGWKVVAMAARYIHTQEDTKRNAANALADLWNEK